MSFLVSSCGKQPQVLTGVKVESQQRDQELWVAFSADLNLGEMSLPNLSLPVIHPRTLGQIGSLELGKSLGVQNFFKLNLNFSAISDLRTSTPKLPNGNTVPLIANNQSITINIPNGGRIYLTLSDTVTALGFAIPIKQFDEIGRRAPGVSLFPLISIDRMVATAGIFTSQTSGQNGFAIVADLSNYIKMQDIYAPAPTVDLVQLNYANTTPSETKVNVINKGIYDLNSRKTMLRLR